MSQAPKPDNGEIGYEVADINARPIALVGLGLGVMTALAFVAMWALFGVFGDREDLLSQPSSPLAEAAGHRLPPLPRLEANLPAKLAELREYEDETLNTYGWEDHERGLIRVPIDRAIELYAERAVGVK